LKKSDRNRNRIPVPKVPDELLNNPRDGMIGFTLSKAAQMEREWFDGILKPFGIRCLHYGVLKLLTRVPPLSQKELADLLMIDPTTMIHILDHLEELGLLVRIKNSKDRRKYVISLTESGKKELEKIELARGSNKDQFYSPLSPVELRQFYEMLKRLVYPDCYE
jgi:DNA-binding MarR family transcriptional regulator